MRNTAANNVPPLSWACCQDLTLTLALALTSALCQVLYERGFPVPEPIDFSRHCLVMQLVDGFPLCTVKVVDDPGKLFSKLMALIVQLGEHGLIHGDFNEFNLMINPVR